MHTLFLVVIGLAAWVLISMPIAFLVGRFLSMQSRDCGGGR